MCSACGEKRSDYTDFKGNEQTRERCCVELLLLLKGSQQAMDQEQCAAAVLHSEVDVGGEMGAVGCDGVMDLEKNALYSNSNLLFIL